MLDQPPPAPDGHVGPPEHGVDRDAEWLLALMIAILAIGIVVDLVIFGTAERLIRRRYGLVTPAG